ncbi:PREDICTED: chromodomain-helicase-DNA-binding protein 1 [Nicrophorus vespilloides]|uniref:Chromodomain-helicase-DNA-binding protein 1 n=1 Tax=Nicrophorus vespilloides TaxID=110193 RepID=A0ABM1MPQ9_NICVS|nr:PREDICTED: chromodomain-helicase-DNA-binding protein 1 [Nicrophorus vespilloides]
MRKIAMKKRGRPAKTENNGESEDSEVLNGSTNEKRRGRNSVKHGDAKDEFEEESSDQKSEQASDNSDVDDTGPDRKKKKKANNRRTSAAKKSKAKNVVSDEEGGSDDEKEESNYEVVNEKRRGRNLDKHGDAKDEFEGESSDQKSEQVSDNSDVDDTGPDRKKKKKKANNKRTSAAKKSKAKNVVSEGGSDDDDKKEESDYEVEAIVNERRVRKSRQYLIRWKGYGSEHDTWEPETTLNCPEILQKYKEDKKKKMDDEENEMDDNKEYEVERILEVHFKKNGKREFLISWKGYSSAERTWEPEENMECTDLIDKFMKKVEKAKRYDPHALRSERKPTDRFTLTTKEGGRRVSKRNSQQQRVRYTDCE